MRPPEPIDAPPLLRIESTRAIVLPRGIHGIVILPCGIYDSVLLPRDPPPPPWDAARPRRHRRREMPRNPIVIVRCTHTHTERERERERERKKEVVRARCWEGWSLLIDRQGEKWASNPNFTYIYMSIGVGPEGTVTPKRGELGNLISTSNYRH